MTTLFAEFFDFLIDKNVWKTIIATLVSEYVLGLTDSLTENIILPIINKDTNNDGKKDLHYLENLKIQLFNINLGVGKLFISLIRFFVMMFLIYIVNLVVKQYQA